MREWNLLRKKGISPKVFVHPDCPVTTPYDIRANHEGPEMKHGTVGVGFFRTVKRHFIDGVPFRVGDCVFGSHDKFLKCLFDDVEAYYRFSANWRPLEQARSNLLELANGGHIEFAFPDLSVFERKIFEGSQGLMLDPRIGTFPHVTPSMLTPHRVYDVVDHIDDLWLVTRAYATRHGNGPLANENRPPSLVNADGETNVCHEFQGEFRTALLDRELLAFAKNGGIDGCLKADTRTHLVVTCVDQLTEFKAMDLGRVLRFDDGDALVRFLATALDINSTCYVSEGPTAKTIREVK